jgi:AcrR family transcriptional regulator
MTSQASGTSPAGGRVAADEPAQPHMRARIQQVALELFTENGYEATSLREIAERLGVTKAALYYHFKTKDDIIASLVETRVAKMDEVIAWARTQPPSAETRREFVLRYAELLEDGQHQWLMRFFERNQTAMHQHKASVSLRDRIGEIMDILATPHETLADRMRRSLAIFALHSAWFVLNDPNIPDQARRAAALEVALSLTD